MDAAMTDAGYSAENEAAGLTNEAGLPGGGVPSVGNPLMSALRHVFGVSFVVLSLVAAWVITLVPLPETMFAAVGFGAGMALFLPGIGLASLRLPFGKSLLSGGMAFLFLTTASLLYRLPLSWGGAYQSHFLLAVCTAMLVLFALLSFRMASPAAGATTCLLAFHLLRTALPGWAPAEKTSLLVGFSLLTILWAVLWLFYCKDRFFSSVAAAFLYAMTTFFGTIGTGEDGNALIILILSLLASYCVFTALAMRYAVSHLKSPSMLVVINAVGFSVALWRNMNIAGMDGAWLGPLVLLTVGLSGAVALRHYPSLRKMRDIFLCQAIAALLLALLFQLPPGMNLLLCASLALLPALAGYHHGGRVVRLAEYLVIGVVFTASFASELPSHMVMLGPLALSLYWVYLAGVVMVSLLLAAIHFGRVHIHEGLDTASLAEHAVQQHLLGVTQACVAALLLMLHTVLRQNDSTSLPLLLAIQGYVFVGLGMVLMTPGISLAGFVPVMAGYAIYYAFAFLVPPSAEVTSQIPVTHLGVLLSVTLVLALLYDWRTGGGSSEPPLVGERTLTALAYAPLLLPLSACLVAGDSFMPLVTSLGIIALSGTVCFKWRRSVMPGLETLGLICLLLSIALYLKGIYASHGLKYPGNDYLPLLGLFLVLLIVIERTFLRNRTVIATLCCLGIALIGALGFYHWNSGPFFALGLFILSLLLLFSGWLFGTRIYQVAGLLLLALAGAWIIAGAPKEPMQQSARIHNDTYAISGRMM